MRCRVGGTPVALVAAVDRIYGSQYFVHRQKPEEPVTRREGVAEARLLCDDRPPRCQVRGTSIAEPTGTQPDVLVLGYREFAPGIGNIRSVGVEIVREAGESVENLPAIPREKRGGILITTAQCEFEWLSSPSGKVEKFQEFKMLAPEIFLAVKFHHPPKLLPVPNGGALFPIAGLSIPEIHDDRLARRLE